MRGDATHASTAQDPKRPGDLTPGDVVVLDGAPFEVVSEPFLGMAGTSLFDKPKLFWRAKVRPLRDARHAAHYATWAVDEDVTVYDRRNGCERDTGARIKWAL